jgi:hypothetical protein
MPHDNEKGRTSDQSPAERVAKHNNPQRRNPIQDSITKRRLVTNITSTTNNNDEDSRMTPTQDIRDESDLEELGKLQSDDSIATAATVDQNSTTTTGGGTTWSISNHHHQSQQQPQETDNSPSSPIDIRDESDIEELGKIQNNKDVNHMFTIDNERNDNETTSRHSTPQPKWNDYINPQWYKAMTTDGKKTTTGPNPVVDVTEETSIWNEYKNIAKHYWNQIDPVKPAKDFVNTARNSVTQQSNHTTTTVAMEKPVEFCQQSQQTSLRNDGPTRHFRNSENGEKRTRLEYGIE